MRVGVLLAGAALLLTGCYDYRVTQPATSSTGTQVRVELSDQGTVAVRPALGDGVTHVEGIVREATSDQLTVSLVNVQRRNERAVSWNGDLLTLAAADMREVRLRTLNRTKSFFTIAGTSAAVVGGIIALARATGLVSGDGGGKPGPKPF